MTKRPSKGQRTYMDRVASDLNEATRVLPDIRAEEAINRRWTQRRKKKQAALDDTVPTHLWDGYPVNREPQPGATFRPGDLRKACLLFHITEPALARLFDVTRRRVANWLSGVTPVPIGVTNYFRYRTTEMIRAYAAQIKLAVTTGVDALTFSDMTPEGQAVLRQLLNVYAEEHGVQADDPRL